MPNRTITITLPEEHKSLTEVEQLRLTQLMDEAQRTMLLKAEAYRLLARRGHIVFTSPDRLTN